MSITIQCSDCKRELDASVNAYDNAIHVEICQCVVDIVDRQDDELIELRAELEAANDLLVQCRPYCPELFI